MESHVQEKKIKGRQMCSFISLLTDPSVLTLSVCVRVRACVCLGFAHGKDTTLKNLLYSHGKPKVATWLLKRETCDHSVCSSSQSLGAQSAGGIVGLHG